MWPPDNATLEEHIIPHKFDNEPVPSFAPGAGIIGLKSVVEVFCPNTFLLITANLYGYNQYQCKVGNIWSLRTPQHGLKCEHGEQI